MSCNIFWPELKKIYFCSPKERGCILRENRIQLKQIENLIKSDIHEKDISTIKQEAQK
jgi:hypothetical protein